MASEDLSTYIQQRLHNGIDRNTIMEELRSAGWEDPDINSAFYQIDMHAQQNSRPRNSLPGPITLFSESAQIYLSNFWKFVCINIITIFLTCGISFIAQLIILFSVFLATAISFWLLIIVIPVILIVIIGSNVVSQWGPAALTQLLHELPQKIDIGDALGRSRRRLLAYFVVYFLFSLFVSFSMLALIIPGIILGVWFLFAPFIVITENINGMNSLLKSREYVRGRFFQIFWREFVLIIVLAVAFSPILFSSVIFEGTYTLASSIILLGYVIVLFISLPVAFVYQFQLYKYTKEIKGQFPWNPTRKQKVLYVLPAVAGLIFLAGGFAVAMYLASSMKPPTIPDKINPPQHLTQTYSDGWYGYTLKYPAGARIVPSVSGERIEDVSVEYYSPESYSITDKQGRSCSVYINDVDLFSSLPGGTYQGLLSGSVLKWEKYTYNDLPVAVPLEPQQSQGIVAPPIRDVPMIMWSHRNSELYYSFHTKQQHEKWCESILKTWSFQADTSLPYAREQMLVRGTAEKYVQQRNLNMTFISGGFIFDSVSGNSITDYSDRAIVTMKGSKDTAVTKIYLINGSGTWVVDRAEFPKSRATTSITPTQIPRLLNPSLKLMKPTIAPTVPPLQSVIPGRAVCTESPVYEGDGCTGYRVEVSSPTDQECKTNYDCTKSANKGVTWSCYSGAECTQIVNQINQQDN